MKNAQQKVIVLADYARAREQLELKDIHEILLFEQRELRNVDQAAANLIGKKHKLKDTEDLRKELAAINGSLLSTSDWLDDEAAIAAGDKRAETIEKFRKLNGQLLARSEVTRKLLVDDMAASRYYEQRWLIDPAKFVALVVVAPVAIATFVERFITNQDKIGIHIGEATVAAGLYLTFKKQADILLDNAQKKAKRVPANIRAVAMSAALSASVEAKPLDEIKPTYPRGRGDRYRMVIGYKNGL